MTKLDAVVEAEKMKRKSSKYLCNVAELEHPEGTTEGIIALFPGQRQSSPGLSDVLCCVARYVALTIVVLLAMLLLQCIAGNGVFVLLTFYVFCAYSVALVIE